jgi:hypothetical protein
LFASSAHLSHIVAIDGSNVSTCPLVTVELPSLAPDEPMRVTLDLCEWQRLAQHIADAAEALGECPLARRLRETAS